LQICAAADGAFGGDRIAGLNDVLVVLGPKNKTILRRKQFSHRDARAGIGTGDCVQPAASTEVQGSHLLGGRPAFRAFFA